MLARGVAGKLSFVCGNGRRPFSLCADDVERLVSVRFVRWCNGNTAPFGGVIHGSNPCRTANLPDYPSSSTSQEPLTSRSGEGLFCPLALELRFNQTSKIPISAGDTPEMRAAWPMVVGLIRASFCDASRRRLGTVEKSNVSGMRLSSIFLNFSTSSSWRSMYPAYLTAISTC